MIDAKATAQERRVRYVREYNNAAMAERLAQRFNQLFFHPDSGMGVMVVEKRGVDFYVVSVMANYWKWHNQDFYEGALTVLETQLQVEKKN